jgi:hypothetical protein
MNYMEELIEKLPSHGFNPLSGAKKWSIDEGFKEACAEVDRLRAALRDAQIRDGNWLDAWGSCRVCGGEIPYGHTNNCDLYKMEQKERTLLEDKARLDWVEAHCQLSWTLGDKIYDWVGTWAMESGLFNLFFGNKHKNCGPLRDAIDAAMKEKI